SSAGPAFRVGENRPTLGRPPPAPIGGAVSFGGAVSSGGSVPSPWSSSRDLSPESSRLIIERAHEELVAGNLDDRRLQQVRPLVRESWQRAWQGKVGAQDLPPLDFSHDVLDAYRTGHPLAGA